MEKNDFPKDPLERCQKRWLNLFFGVIKCILKKDPVLCRGIYKALEQEGLRPVRTNQQVFAMNPTNDILERSARFLQHGTIPKLGRGKGEKVPSLRDILSDYWFLMFFLKDLPKKPRNPNFKRKVLKESIKQCSKIISSYGKISVEKLDELGTSPKTPKQIVLEIIGELYNKKSESIDKLLDKARKKFPDFATS